MKTVSIKERKRIRGAFVPMFSEEEVRERKRVRSSQNYYKNRREILAKLKVVYLAKRKTIRAIQKKYRKTAKGYSVWLESHERYVKNNPLKVKARHAVSNAIRTGKLKRLPCVVCGERAHAHHENYHKPLDIIWMCRDHHQEYHNVHISR